MYFGKFRIIEGGGSMLVALLVIAVISLVMTIRKQKKKYLLLPIGMLGAYFIVEIARVPLGFVETVELIFNLK